LQIDTDYKWREAVRTRRALLREVAARLEHDRPAAEKANATAAAAIASLAAVTTAPDIVVLEMDILASF
jgi:hypothetical protein